MWQARNCDSKPHRIGGALLPPCPAVGVRGPWVEMPTGFALADCPPSLIASGVIEVRQAAPEYVAPTLTPMPPQPAPVEPEPVAPPPIAVPAQGETSAHGASGIQGAPRRRARKARGA